MSSRQPKIPIVASLQAIQPYEAGKPLEEVQRELGLRSVIKLASNENPLGPSPKALAAVKKALAGNHRYPDASASDLRAALSEIWGLDGSHFIFGNGSNEILVFAALAYCNHGEKVAFSQHSFSVYRLAALQARAVPEEVPSPDFEHNLEALIKASRGAKLLYLCNPNNPTGSFHKSEVLEKTLEKIAETCLVVLDEAYAEYCGHSFAMDKRWLAKFPNLLICRTFSKVYGLAGWRIGYGVGHPSIVESLEKVRQPFNVNRLGLFAALAALGDKSFILKTLALNQRGLDQFQSFFNKNRIWFKESRANFVFFKPPKPQPKGCKNWFHYFLTKGVIVRPFGEYLRVTTGTLTENQRFMKTFSAAL